jgi:predicted transcriptional regulator
MFEKGKAANPKGKKPGTLNKTTVEFKEAVTNLMTLMSPRMAEWLERIAATDPKGALDTMSKLAEYAYPKLARSELVGKDGKDLIPESVQINLVRPNATPTT